MRGFLVQGLVRKTWDRGNNDEFLGRAIKYAQRRKWSSLLKAFHTAIGKVPVLISLELPLLLDSSSDLRHIRWRFRVVFHM